MPSQIAVLSSSEPTKFCQFYDLSAQYIPEALRITKLFENAIDSDLKFNLSQAEQIAQTAKLIIDKVIDSNIIRHNGSSADLFNDFQTKLENQYGISLSAKQIQSAQNFFRAAFTDLPQENENAWIFWSKDSSNKTSYYYRTIYATTKNDQGQTYLIVSPVALKVSVSIVTERILCHISTNATYEVFMQGMVVESPVATSQVMLELGEMDTSRDKLPEDLLKKLGLSLNRMMPIPKGVPRN